MSSRISPEFERDISFCRVSRNASRSIEQEDLAVRRELLAWASGGARRLLEEGGLEVWYQPILEASSGTVVGVEALARLREADGTIRYPNQFLPQLEVADLMELSQAVLAQALLDLAVLEDRGYPLWVSVNMAPESFSHACVPCLQSILANSGIAPSRITLEILESSDFLGMEESIPVLESLRSRGLHLALDDVGTAYGSLLRLKELPVDKIKLDQGFIRTLETRPQDLHFVGALQDLADGMGVELVVEGVETVDILDAVTAMGANLLQGYAISRPVPLPDLLRFLGEGTPVSRGACGGFLGLYAAQLSEHGTLKKVLRQHPQLVPVLTQVAAEDCSIHVHLHRLDRSDGHRLDRFHRTYHEALSSFIRNGLWSSPAGWIAVDQAQEDLLAAILAEWRISRTETGDDGAC